VDIARLIIDPSVEVKIRAKHAPLAAEDVRSALVYGRDIDVRWDDEETHGLRLIAHARTYDGVEFVAYLMPLNENDPEEGTFVLKTAIPNLST
jgi:hypothetical protein